METSIRALLGGLRRAAETDPVVLALAMLFVLSAFTAVAVVATLLAAPIVLSLGVFEGLQRTASRRRCATG